MPLLGLDVAKKEIDRLFDSWDPDRSGEISLQELNKQLRRGGEIKLDKKMLAGGAGEIVLQLLPQLAQLVQLAERRVHLRRQHAVQLLDIGAGTNEIRRMLIGRELFQETA